MNLNLIYLTGITLAIVFALIWSLLLDKNRPATGREFIAKLLARALFIVVLLAFVVGILMMALPGEVPAWQGVEKR